MHRIETLAVILSAALLALPAAAQQETTYDRVDFSVTAEREVENDTLIAVVYAEVEDDEQADAANAVNEAIQWAADQARAAGDIESQTARYTTRPVYAANSRRIVRWIARQSLKLESRDAESLSTLLGQLQTRVAIESMNQGLSKEARDGVEDELVAEALARFRHRADLVAAEFGRTGYRLVSVNINSTGLSAQFQARATYGADALAKEMAPVIDTGTRTLSVTANGSIELAAD